MSHERARGVVIGLTRGATPKGTLRTCSYFVRGFEESWGTERDRKGLIEIELLGIMCISLIILATILPSGCSAQSWLFPEGFSPVGVPGIGVRVV